MPAAKPFSSFLTVPLFRLLRVIRPARERVTIGEFNDHVEREHVVRYRFALPYCAEKSVADMACGTGYGSKIIAEVAASVTSFDKDSLCGNRVLNLDTESWPDRFDVIVSFETIEHLENPEFFLRNVHASCGLFIVSSPIGEMWGYNPHHKQVWSLDEFKSMIEPLFDCQYYGQENEAIQPAGPNCRFVIAVCKPRQAGRD